MSGIRALFATLVCVCAFSAPLCAADLRVVPSPEPPAPPLPSERPTVTHHTVEISGRRLAYTAAAGVLVVRNAADKPLSSMSYVAYTLDHVRDPAHRAVSFVYNGGPGSSTFFLHMGAFGPKRVVTSNAMTTPPPPYRLVDNESSLLDVSDLVFIDAPGTGYGRVIDGHAKEVFGIDQDAAAFADFIQRYITRNERWNSPKFLIGESYGTTRSANLVNVLHQRGIDCNGVVLLSTALDYKTIIPAPDNDLPFVLFLPSEAAAAWYHHALPSAHPDMAAFLADVRRFALGEYTMALVQGDRLDPAERRRITATLHADTGLNQRYIDLANLRVGPDYFEKELLRDRRRTIGRLDARFLGIDANPNDSQPEYDPTDSALTPVYTVLFNAYTRTELRWNPALPYRTNDYDEVFKTWDFRRENGGFEGKVLAPAVTEDLRQALSQNPSLRVFTGNGYFDLATPFAGTEYTIGHLSLDPTLLGHVEFHYYDSGHLIYEDPASRRKLSADLRTFIGGLAR
ncbi:MAG: peptidase S10 [Candidatus Eremiobacteraeota bacterium]|nr:peptidase S10 [Candidatus Eremiobacteraeota bacterium]MBC5824583.1 peptidase S10 [Candidatus Eremiobacteraeota bacterium]